MHLLLATEGSEHSAVAVQLAAEIAKIGAWPVTVLTVIKDEEERAQGEKILSQVKGVLQTAVSSLTVKIRIGQPAPEIVQEAREGGYDLIVLGQRDRHSLLSRLFGPVTQQVINHSSCPVLIAKETAVPPRRILLCDSGVRSPVLLNRFMERLPDLLDNAYKVTVLHVMSQISATPDVSAAEGEQLQATAEELMAAAAPEGNLLERDMEILEDVDVEPEPLVRHGLVVDEILAEAEQGDYDLVVIGAHQHETWRRFLLDDLAAQLVQQIDRAILIVQ
jgi:nucleotide-binding universal stress UspA family protein